MNSKIKAISFITLFSAVGCAHSHQRGSVVFVDSPSEGHICMGKSEVTPGDRVSFFKTECSSASAMGEEGRSRGARTTCKKISIGEGRVVDVSDDHFSRVKAGEGVTLSAGYIVEKVRQ